VGAPCAAAPSPQLRAALPAPPVRPTHHTRQSETDHAKVKQTVRLYTDATASSSKGAAMRVAPRSSSTSMDPSAAWSAAGLRPVRSTELFSLGYIGRCVSHRERAPAGLRAVAAASARDASRPVLPRHPARRSGWVSLAARLRTAVVSCLALRGRPRAGCSWHPCRARLQTNTTARPVRFTGRLRCPAAGSCKPQQSQRVWVQSGYRQPSPETPRGSTNNCRCGGVATPSRRLPCGLLAAFRFLVGGADEGGAIVWAAAERPC
jgi:hypothetical protein